MSVTIREQSNHFPLEDLKTLVLNSEFSGMLSDAMTLVVDNKGAYDEITQFYSLAREEKNRIESCRKFLVEPYRAKVNFINDQAKEAHETLDQIIALANKKGAHFIELQEQRKRKEAEEMQKLASIFDTEIPVESAPKSVRGNGATATSKVVKRHRLVDISKVPARYLMVNQDLVEQDLKLGVNEIPGLEVYEETITTLRVR